MNMHHGRYYLIIKILAFKWLKLNFKLRTPNILNKVGLFVVHKERNTHTNHPFFWPRVLRVGGTIVLLLSEGHHRHLQGGEASGGPLDPQGGRTGEPGGERRLTGAEKAAVSEPAPSSSAASSQERVDRMPPLGSLVPVDCYRVSLGKTDALISKYKKSCSPGR